MASPSEIEYLPIATLHTLFVEQVIPSNTFAAGAIKHGVLGANRDTGFQRVVVFSTSSALSTVSTNSIITISAHAVSIREDLVRLGTNWDTILTGEFCSSWACVVALLDVGVLGTWQACVTRKIESRLASLRLAFACLDIATIGTRWYTFAIETDGVGTTCSTVSVN